MAAERQQGKPARKRKRDEEDAAEGDVASSDEEAEIGEGSNELWAPVTCCSLEYPELVEHSDACPSWDFQRL